MITTSEARPLDAAAARLAEAKRSNQAAIAAPSGADYLGNLRAAVEARHEAYRQLMDTPAATPDELLVKLAAYREHAGGQLYEENADLVVLLDDVAAFISRVA